jgi:hypothetical protein
LVLLASVVAGCRPSITEVVVVLQSDLVVPADADAIQVAMDAGPAAPMIGQRGAAAIMNGLTAGFPLAIGFTSGGMTPNFSLVVQLQLQSRAGGPPSIVVSRTISDIRFVDEKTMMVVVPLLRACACDGTSCPSAGDPACDAIRTPTLQPFDPAVAPPSTMMTGPYIQL